MEEDVCQHGRDRRALRTTAIPCFQGAVPELKRRLQPPLHIEEDPPQVGVVSYRCQDERVIERVEKRPEIKIDRPVVFPTPLPAYPQRIMSRPSWPIPIGVRVKHRLHLRLQVQVRNRLSDPVCNRGHAERSHASAALLRYLNRLDRRRHVTTRGHPIPDLGLHDGQQLESLPNGDVAVINGPDTQTPPSPSWTPPSDLPDNSGASQLPLKRCGRQSELVFDGVDS